MKKKLFSILRSKVIMIWVASCSLAVLVISSCKKDDPNYANQFIGTWTSVSNSCGAGNGSFTISAGSGKNGLATSGSVGNSGCVVPVTQTGTASSNSFSFPAQTFTDGCGLKYTVSLSGTISGNTINYTESVSGAVNASCTGTATKQ